MKWWSIALVFGATPWAHAAEPPGEDLLEFLGSIDTAEEGWTQYLEQEDLEKIARGARKPTPASPPPAGPPAAAVPTPGTAKSGIPDGKSPPPPTSPGNSGGQQP